MTGKSYRKLKNSGEIDSWLETIGYYRKNVAYDETCLFRAIAEQLYSSQMLHERVRKECIDYGKKNPGEFVGLVESRKKWKKYLNQLAIHMVVCGHIEIELISRTYKRDIILFDGINFQMKNVTQNKYSEIFQICLVSKDHYDVIYTRDYITTAGFCQSIVYGILYENVFGLENVSDVVNTMLYENKTSPLIQEKHTDDDVKAPKELVDFVMNSNHSDVDLHSPGSPFPFSKGLAPFPYKVAKALDPDIYRNIAYDTWTEMRREMRLGEWYHGDDKLILGTCCELKMEDGTTARCYIQAFLKGNEQCVVYIPTLAERKTVKYTDLSPEANAKPWPLPYRFAKSCQIPTATLTVPTDRKNMRKFQDKKFGYKSENNGKMEVQAFEGCPLQMQSPSAAPCEQERQDMVVVTPAPATPNSVSTPQIFSPTDMSVTSPFVYSYPVSPYSYEVHPTTNEYSSTATSLQYQQPTPPVYYIEGEARNSIMSPPVLPPPSMYPVYSVPTTPVICTPPETAEINTPPIPPSPSNHVPLYTPTVDVQYMPASPFIYPATPPAWFQSRVNSQGFIFPTTAVAYNNNGY